MAHLDEIPGHEEQDTPDREGDRLRHPLAGPAGLWHPPAPPGAADAAPPEELHRDDQPDELFPARGQGVLPGSAAPEPDRAGPGQQPGAEDPERAGADRQQRDPGAIRGVPPLLQPRGARGGPGTAQRSRTRGIPRPPFRRIHPRKSFQEPTRQLPDRHQPHLADRHLSAASERQGRGGTALRRLHRAAERLRDRPGRGHRRELFPADGARQTDREPESDHRVPGAEPRDRRGQEVARPRHRAGRPAVRGRGPQEPEREADRTCQDIIEAENRINVLAYRYPQPVERNSAVFYDLEHQHARRRGALRAAPEPARHPPGRA